jgi:microcystin-dependent protein
MPYEPVLGQIMPTAFAKVPKGWHLCDGSLLSISQNTALFSLFGTYYGGDGKLTFGLPDLRGRAILGAASQTVMGMLDGVTSVTLSDPELPHHNHRLSASTTKGAGRSQSPAAHLFGENTAPGGETIFGIAGSGEVALATKTNLTPNGGSQPHNNMQPYLTINYVVALVGIYPSRL